MPIYSYKCKECSATINVVREISDTSVPSCSKCNIAMQKLFQPIRVISKNVQQEEAKTRVYSSIEGARENLKDIMSEMERNRK